MTTAGEPVVLGATSTMAAVSTGDTTTGEATAVSARPLITDLADAPLDVPVALRREADGLLHPDATAITDMRTGAVTALGAKHIARKGSKVLGHIGARGTA